MAEPSRRDVLRYGAALSLSPAFSVAGSLLAASPATTAGQKPTQPAGDPYADGVLVDGDPPMPAAGSFTVVVLPDTQRYCQSFPEEYMAQTEWIVQNREKRSIACVLHLGDITNRNTAEQWEVAVKAMNRLEGHVPYFLTAGNHDYLDASRKFTARKATRLNDYFPIAKFRGLPTFGGTYDREPDRMENAYYLFSAGGRNFLVLALEFGPRNDVIRWANEVVARHGDREAILITHAYCYHDDTRFDWAKYGGSQTANPHEYHVTVPGLDDVNDGEDLWQKLVARHGNFILVISGHVLGDGLGRLVTPAPDGREIPQMLVNFQRRPRGGDGWLRLLEFCADGRTVNVVDYSPTRKQCNESSQNKFTVKTAPIRPA